jgi:hypothetical protein
MNKKYLSFFSVSSSTSASANICANSALRIFPIIYQSMLIFIFISHNWFCIFDLIVLKYLKFAIVCKFLLFAISVNLIRLCNLYSLVQVCLVLYNFVQICAVVYNFAYYNMATFTIVISFKVQAFGQKTEPVLP